MEKESFESNNLPFEKIEYKENVTLYLFGNIQITIDTTGKNQKELPEILFSTSQNPSDEKSLDQPEQRLEGINMSNIAECIQEVAKDTGYNKFWFYPHGDDDPENKEKREQARLRLFSRYATITPSETGFGYVIEV